MAKKAAVLKKAAPAKPAGRKLGPPAEGLVRVKVLIAYEGHNVGDEILVPERKVRDSARLLRKGFIKPV